MTSSKAATQAAGTKNPGLRSWSAKPGVVRSCRRVRGITPWVATERQGAGQAGRFHRRRRLHPQAAVDVELLGHGYAAALPIPDVLV